MEALKVDLDRALLHTVAGLLLLTTQDLPDEIQHMLHQYGIHDWSELLPAYNLEAFYCESSREYKGALFETSQARQWQCNTGADRVVKKVSNILSQ
jgi:hypothetical protein